MISLDFSKRAVLVTGGTRGFGRAIAKQFARTGATVYATHRWGSADESEIIADFERDGLRPPHVVECDASDPAANRALLNRIHKAGEPLHAIVSNVAFGPIVSKLEDLKKSSLDIATSYSAWPVVDLVLAAREIPGFMPKYVIAVLSDPHCHEGYDILGSSKRVLEQLVRYLAVRLKSDGVRVNVVVPGVIDSENLEATVGKQVAAALRARGDVMLDAQKMAGTCVALASGLMDSVTGHTLVIDEGWSLVSPITMLTNTLGNFGFPKEEMR